MIAALMQHMRTCKSANARDLATLMNAQESAVHAMLATLEAKGLVMRDESPCSAGVCSSGACRTCPLAATRSLAEAQEFFWVE